MVFAGVNVNRFRIDICSLGRRAILEGVLHCTCGLTLGRLEGFLVATRLVIRHAGTGRNQTADDDVFLEATQFVALAHDGRLGQYAGGFLERRRRNERVSGQRGLGDTQQHVFVRGRNAALGDHAIVFVQQFGTLDLLTGDEAGIARINDVHTTQHLTHDDFDVLVVDLHTLQPVDILNFVDDVDRQLFDALETQDIVRIGRPVDDHFALVHHLAVVHQNLFFLGNQELVADAFQVGDDQALLALGVFPERNRTRNFGQHAGILGRTGFEELGHARQTPGNVAGLLRFLRNTRQDLTHLHVLAVAHGDQGANGERDVHGVLGTGNLDLFARLVDQLDLRAHHGLATARLGRDHHEGRKTGDLVELTGNGHAFLDVLEAYAAVVFRHDRAGQGIPRCQALTSLDDVAIAHRNGGTVRYLVALTLATVVVENDDLARTGNGHTLTLGVGDIAQADGKAHRTGRLRFDRACRGGTRGRTTNVERTHRQLRARFADRLGGDHTHGFTAVDHGAAAEVAAIAVCAQTMAGFAGQRCANLDFVDAQRIDELDAVFVQQRTGLDGGFLGVGIDDVDGSHAAQNAVAQRFDDFAAFHQGLHGVTLRGAAIVFGNDQVLRDVDQTASEVTRVRCLERRIGQTLTRTVRRDEVLQYVQPFAEVGGNGRFDDRAIGLGHEATHAGQLTDLRRRTPGAGVGHHVDGVERFLAHFFAKAVDDRFGRQLFHHGLADAVAGLAPDVDNVVVAFLRGNETRGVLLVDFLHFAGGLRQDFFLDGRHDHVAHGDGNAATRGQTEARLHELISEDDRGAQTAATERLVDEARNFLLLQGPVQHFERQTLRQNLGKQRTADRGLEAAQLALPLAVLVLLVFHQAHGDAALQFDHARIVGALHLGNVGEERTFTLAVDALAGGVVQTQHEVLRRHDRRFAVGREQHVVRGEHERACLELGFERQRHVNGHLVTVEVGVEGRADERVQLNGLAFDEHRLERLNAQTVQRGRPVEHDGVFANDFFENVPHHRLVAVDHLLGRLDRGGQAHDFELVEDEGLEQFKRHELGQTALMQLQLRAPHYDRTAGVVDTLAQQVLTEAAALALDHVGERLELTLVGARHGLAAATVVEQRIDGFLQHALFVAQNDVGRLELEQTLETVVAVDDATVQIVQIRGGEAAPVERHQRAQIGRQHRQHFHDHPVGLDARLLEAFQHLEALGDLLDLGVGRGGLELGTQRIDFAVDIDR